MVNYPEPKLSANCSKGTKIVCDPVSGSRFPVGVSIVRCKVVGPAGELITWTEEEKGHADQHRQSQAFAIARRIRTLVAPGVKDGTIPVYVIVDDTKVAHPDWHECRADNNVGTGSGGCQGPN